MDRRRFDMAADRDDGSRRPSRGGSGGSNDGEVGDVFFLLLEGDHHDRDGAAGACRRWLGRAVLCDEARPEAEALLAEPLESGRLYGDGAAQLAAALGYLKSQRQEEPPPPRRHHRRSASPPPPPFALTPVVLSGLIAALARRRERQEDEREREEEKDQSQEHRRGSPRGRPSAPALPSSSELVLACHALRASALRRVRARKRLRSAARRGLPLLAALAAVAAVIRSGARDRASLARLRYCGAGRTADGGPAAHPCDPARRIAEAALWERCGAGLLGLMEGRDDSAPAAVVDGCGKRRQRRRSTSSAAMHSVLVPRPALTRNDVLAGRRVDPPPPFCREEDSRARRHPLRGLGDTAVNRLVKRAVESHHRPADNSSPSSSSAGGRVSVLDAGCGIGGTLYGLLAAGPSGGGGVVGRSSPSVFESMRYDGIAVSEAEVYHARALAEHHRRQGHLEGVQVRFERRSFDDPWDDDATSNETEERYYSAVIAVESLAYSRNLRAALSNLVSRLATGGIAVVADDVAMPRDADRVASSELGRGRPGLVAHATWDALLRELGCPLLEGYDLTFEHDLLTSPSEIERENACAPDGRGPSWPFSSLPFSSFVANGFARLWRWWGWRLAPSGPGAAARLVQLREDVADLRRSVLQRHQEHAVRGSLGYHLYVCRKV